MDTSDLKILLVEDDVSLLEILKVKLADERFQVLTAMDGEAGLALALSEQPDIILLDIVMPKKDGLTMLRELRTDAWGKTVPVILLSNLDSTESMQEALGKGAIDYMVKSRFDADQVVAKVKERLHCQ